MERLSELREEFEGLLKERETAHVAKVKELTANNDEGACSTLTVHVSRC